MKQPENQKIWITNQTTNGLTGGDAIICITCTKYSWNFEIICLYLWELIKYCWNLCFFICGSWFLLVATSAAGLFCCVVCNKCLYKLQPVFLKLSTTIICGSWFLPAVTSAAGSSSCKSSTAPCDCSGRIPEFKKEIWLGNVLEYVCKKTFRNVIQIVKVQLTFLMLI